MLIAGALLIFVGVATLGMTGFAYMMSTTGIAPRGAFVPGWCIVGLGVALCVAHHFVR